MQIPNLLLTAMVEASYTNHYHGFAIASFSSLSLRDSSIDFLKPCVFSDLAGFDNLQGPAHNLKQTHNNKNSLKMQLIICILTCCVLPTSVVIFHTKI